MLLKIKTNQLLDDKETPLRRILLRVIVAIACFTLLFPSASFAADAANGATIFSANCASCHMAGGNLVNQAKTLKKADLEHYSMASLDAIMTQVMNGKAAMPSFKSRLSSQEIEDVATYVLEQAEKGW